MHLCASFGLVLLLIVTWLESADAFWRVNCAIIQEGRVDPVVDPGVVAGHAHTIVGGANIGVNTSYEDLLNSECTSCEIAADRSAYWSPILYYQYTNGSFFEVPHSGSVVYYLGRGPNAANIIPFPKGLQMLSGNKAARSFDNQTYTWGNATYPGQPVANRVTFACLDVEPMAEQPYMYRTSCIYGMRASVMFQSCWNGIDLTSADQSHVAYQSSIDNGVCPPDYPYQIPQLFLETDWSTVNVPDMEEGGQFVFSQGDPTGYGFHADFVNGWEEDVLQEAVTNCLATNNNGQINACPVLEAQDSNGFSFNCPQRPPQIGEAVEGLIDQLPGCITITYGPEDAPSSAMNCNASVPRPSITTTIMSTPLPTLQPVYGQSFGLADQVYLGCFNDSAAGIRTLNAKSISDYAVMTVEWCQAWCMSYGYRLSGVEYAQECHCDNALNPTAINGSDQCSWNCGGTMVKGGAQEICGGYAYISVFNNTNAAFNATGSNANSAGLVAPLEPLKNYSANYLGCATDLLGGSRTLTGISFSANNMTVEVCAAYCEAGPSGYQYYGVEYTSQCYCGDTIAGANFVTNATSTPNNGSCDMRCGGDGAEMCGGSGALSLYRNVVYEPPSVKSQVGMYVSQGCLTDPQGAADRSLQGASTSSVNMTVETCVNYCLGNEYHYAGVEYAEQCYCGNSIVASSGGKVLSCPTANLTVCPGNVLEYCGGSFLMVLYHYSPTP